MATYTLIAETGGFGWYHSWLLKDGTWDDAGWWADVAAWEPNEGINFGIGESGGTGSLTVVGQDANKHVVHLFGTGSFALQGQDAFRDITEAAQTGLFSVAGQDVKESISIAHAFGSFSLTGQDANKGISNVFGTGIFSVVGQDTSRNIIEFAETGIFVFNGVPITKAYSERVDAGEFTLIGQDSGRNVVEALEPGYFAWQHSWLLKDGVWNDNGWWADVAAWEPNPGINFGISEIAGTGVFVLVGQGAAKKLSKLFGTGNFNIAMQEVVARVPRYESDKGRTSATLLTGRPNSAHILQRGNSATLLATKNGYL